MFIVKDSRKEPHEYLLLEDSVEEKIWFRFLYYLATDRTVFDKALFLLLRRLFIAWVDITESEDVQEVLRDSIINPWGNCAFPLGMKGLEDTPVFSY